MTTLRPVARPIRLINQTPRSPLKTDFDEVEAMTNPLGAGKLGDHLK